MKISPLTKLHSLVSILLFFVAFGLPAKAFSSDLKITVNQMGDFGLVTVDGLDAETRIKLRDLLARQLSWQEVFSVKLRSPLSKVPTNDMPQLSGKYQFTAAGFCFTPAFPPEKGLQYEIRIQIPAQELITKRVLLEKKSLLGATASTIEFFPSGKTLPANTLRIYLYFSKAMKRGQVEKKIHLLDENGEVIKAAFILGPMGELWDPSLRRLTLLLDPGRIKRDVRPNRELGPALITGKKRSVVIQAGFEDADGLAFTSEFRKDFIVSEAIYQAIDVKQWQVASPKSASTEPLRIKFPYPLDQGMLRHSIRVFDPQGNTVSGKVVIGKEEQQWQFTPNQPWQKGVYTIRVPMELEDVSGNNLFAPMDVDLSKKNSPKSVLAKKKKWQQILFQVH